jgi:hypothetical protein
LGCPNNPGRYISKEELAWRKIAEACIAELTENPPVAVAFPNRQVLDAEMIRRLFARFRSLTPEEHDEARSRAFYRSTHRGGGEIPPYDPTLAADDFCRAAGEIMSERIIA